MPGGSERCLAALKGFVATGVCFCRGWPLEWAMLASAALASRTVGVERWRQL